MFWGTVLCGLFIARARMGKSKPYGRRGGRVVRRVKDTKFVLVVEGAIAVAHKFASHDTQPPILEGRTAERRCFPQAQERGAEEPRGDRRPRASPQGCTVRPIHQSSGQRWIGEDFGLAGLKF